MKEIILSGGEVTKVDDDVYEWASKHSWFLHDGYAARFTKRQRIILLHEEILGIDSEDCDPINN
jgi:hypothetical protein